MADGSHKIVFVGGEQEWLGVGNEDERENMKYNFETEMWVNGLGERYKGGKLVE